MNRRKAFTLAETLIALAVIGVVAALTIPTLINNQRDKSTVTAVKKAYSELSSAFTLAVKDNGSPDSWNLVGYAEPAGAVNLLNKLAPYLKITKNCGLELGCFPEDTQYLDLGGNDTGNVDAGSFYAKAQLADGSLLMDYIYSEDCSWDWGSGALDNVCAQIVVDVNGVKGPNTWGLDFFEFYVTKNGIVPNGTASDNFCTFDKYCRDKSAVPDGNANTGEACAAWVIYNENLDYQYTSNLGWDGKLHK